MNSALGLFAITAVVMVGFAVVWANPGRIVNRVFASFSFHVGLWLLAVHLAVVSGERPEWIRIASAMGAMITPHMWLLKEAILRRDRLWAELPKRKYVWFGAAALLVGLIYTDWYIRPTIEGETSLHFGRGYFVYMLGTLTMYGLLCHETVRQIRRHTGLHRLELQILLLGGSTTAITVLGLMAMRAILRETWPIQLQPFVVLVFYTGTVVAITTKKIFNARQIVFVATQKMILVTVATAAAYGVDGLLHLVGVAEPLAMFVTVAIALWFVATLNSWLQKIFRYYPEAMAARSAAFSAAQRETRVDALESSFRAVLKGWGKTDKAIIISGAKDSLIGDGIKLGPDSIVLSAMRQLRWVTPERLGRERTTEERQELGRFLDDHDLGVMVLGEGPALTILAGVGMSASRLPFTYPQVTQLVELASIMESAFERAHFSVKAQHAEQLATVGLLGASLAHEIRNPLVSIKTFVQLLPTHHHDPAFREKFFRLIGDEVNRIDQLTEQLLDLASPRTYMAELVELHPVLRASLDLVAAKAVHRNVQFLTDFKAAPDRAFTDASAAKQVMLNLCFNAIQAVESREGERWVRISTRNTNGGVEMAVEDSGPGIAPEIRPRLFQPFQSTKSTGFGLGLAICNDILTTLNATISVDPPVSGRGAAFRVNFPCQPSSS